MDQSQKSLCQSKIPGFSQSSNLSYELEIIHNCLDMAVSLLYHCEYITKFILLMRKSAVGS